MVAVKLERMPVPDRNPCDGPLAALVAHFRQADFSSVRFPAIEMVTNLWRFGDFRRPFVSGPDMTQRKA